MYLLLQNVFKVITSDQRRDLRGNELRREEFDIPEVFFEMSTSFLPPPDDADSYSTKKEKQKSKPCSSATDPPLPVAHHGNHQSGRLSCCMY